MKIGILHPGSMGVSVARSILNGGHDVYWASEGRGPATTERAREHGLTDVGSLANLCQESEVIFSICPPESASDVASAVRTAGFAGTFVDCNAISPQRMQTIADELSAAGIAVVDGGIIGHPAWQPGTTWLYLSGTSAEKVAACGTAGPLHCEVIGAEIGQASALKMCYAALSKGTTALLCAILATADELGVREELCRHWDRDSAGMGEKREMAVRGVTAKAWRFVGEMHEIAATFEAAGQPAGFHRTAAELYELLAHLKDGPHPTGLSETLDALKGRVADNAK